VALKTNCIKNVKFRIIKIRTGCQHMGYIYYSQNLNWAAKNFNWAAWGPRVGHSWSRTSPRFLYKSNNRMSVDQQLDLRIR